MKQLLILSLVCILFSCQNDPRALGEKSMDGLGTSMAMEDQMDIEAPRTSEPPPPPSSRDESKVIKTGNIDFEVDDISYSKAKVDSLVKAHKGYYEDENYSSGGYAHTFSLVIRLPNASFDSLVYSLEKGIGKLVSKQINADDVTEEFVDLNIRLENNLSYLAQYKEILKKAKTIEEILEVKERMRGIEEAIESKKGRIKYLTNQVKYSTLNVELQQQILDQSGRAPSFLNRFVNAIKGGVDIFSDTFLALVYIWPFILLLIGILFFRKKVIGWFRRK